MARYLYGQDGSTIGYMDPKDKYLYSMGGTAIAYWDSRHKYMYTPDGQTFGYIDSRGQYLYTLSGTSRLFPSKIRVTAPGKIKTHRTNSESNYLDGGKNYKLTLPPNPPAKNFWSVIVYDTQTRSMLQTDQQFPTKGSHSAGIQKNADGSYDLYFGPKAPTGKESNWVQTVPGRGWFTILRLYGPLDPWFDKTWRPGEFELQK